MNESNPSLSRELAELRRRIERLELSSRLPSASIGQGGIRSEDFDGDPADPVASPGTAGWFLGGADAVFNTLVLRDRIVGPDSLGVAFDGEGETIHGFLVPGSHGHVLEADIAVPTWATEALVHLTVNASVRNDRASPDFAYLSAGIDAVYGGEAFDLFSASGGWGTLSASAVRVIAGVSGTIDLAVRMRTDSGINWTSSSFHIANLDAIVVFKA